MEVRTGGTLLAVVALIAGCYGGPPASRYVSVLDELHPPTGWHILATKIHGPDADAAIHCSPITDSECPSALRFFGVGGDPDAIRAASVEMARADGFQVDRQVGPHCRPAPGAAYCAVELARPSEHLFVAIYGSPGEAGLAGAESRGLVVVVTARG